MARKKGSFDDPVIESLMEAFGSVFQSMLCYCMVEGGPEATLLLLDKVKLSLEQQRETVLDMKNKMGEVTATNSPA